MKQLIGKSFKCNIKNIEFKVEKENKHLESYADILHTDGSKSLQSFSKILSDIKSEKLKRIRV
jgi:hypothetical protein